MKRRSKCVQCGRVDNDCGPISRRGLCQDCGIANMHTNTVALQTRQGPAFNFWAKRHATGVAAYQQGLQARIDHQARQLG